MVFIDDNNLINKSGKNIEFVFRATKWH